MSETMEVDKQRVSESKTEKPFTLKKWNVVAMWSWDVECDECAICRAQVMGKYVIPVGCSIIFFVKRL